MKCFFALLFIIACACNNKRIASTRDLNKNTPEIYEEQTNPAWFG